MREVLAACLLAAALSACGARTDFGGGRLAEASGGSSGAGGARAAGTAFVSSGGAFVASGGSSPIDDACKVRDVGSTLGIPVVEGVLAGASAYTPSCGGGRGPEAWFRWTAPFTGDWGFDASGSDGPVIVSLFYDDNGCNRSPATACTDNGRTIGAAHVEKDQIVTVLVDTDVGTTGYTLNITGPVGWGGCPSVDVGSALGVVRVGRFVDDAMYPTTLKCNGNFSATLVTAWTAPTSAYFSFETTGSNLDTLLEVREGCDYTGILGCSDDYMGMDAKLTLFLGEGTRVNVILGGKAATRPPDARYVLSIHENVDR